MQNMLKKFAIPGPVSFPNTNPALLNNLTLLYMNEKTKTNTTYCSMASRTECLLHASLSACQNIAAGAHGSAYQHRLTCQLVVHWNQGVVRWKCSSRPLYNTNSPPHL